MLWRNCLFLCRQVLVLAYDGPELIRILLPWPPKCQEYKHRPPNLAKTSFSIPEGLEFVSLCLSLCVSVCLLIAGLRWTSLWFWFSLLINNVQYFSMQPAICMSLWGKCLCRAFPTEEQPVPPIVEFFIQSLESNLYWVYGFWLFSPIPESSLSFCWSTCFKNFSLTKVPSLEFC